MSNKKIDKHSTNISFTKNQFKRYKKSKIENLPPTLEAFQKFKYNNPKKWEDMKRQYRLWKYNKPDESVAKIILNPVLTKKQIEKLKRTPLHKRIGLSITNFNDDNIIKVQEKDFAKKFTNLGYSIKWINRIQPSDNGGYIPTNDFQWNSKEWELKKPKVKRYNSIFNMIKKATNKGKKRFILDFGQSSINRKLAENLSTYNIRNPHKQILELLVFEKHTLMRILLKKK